MTLSKAILTSICLLPFATLAYADDGGTNVDTSDIQNVTVNSTSTITTERPTPPSEYLDNIPPDSKSEIKPKDPHGRVGMLMKEKNTSSSSANQSKSKTKSVAAKKKKENAGSTTRRRVEVSKSR